ncbi:MAG: hypothetical protein ACI9RU_002104 [Litorivivens sp.]|jgi:hypothetical protein
MDKGFWKNKYQDGSTGWDTGAITTPLKEYFDQLTDKSLRILIPGAGNSHEAEYLFASGFTDVTVLDIAEEPLQNIALRLPYFPKNKLVCADFFKHSGQYDIIIEQTFFCALPPTMRDDYVKHMSTLLAPKGKLTGLMFCFPLTEKGPPFGGSKDEYLQRFSDLFKVDACELAYNSIEPRRGNELWVSYSGK